MAGKVLFHLEKTLVGQVLSLGGVFEDVNLRPDLRAQESSPQDKGSEEMAVPVEVAVESLLGEGVLDANAEVQRLCSEPANIPQGMHHHL